MELAFGLKFGGSEDDPAEARGGGHHDHEHDAEGRCQKPSETKAEPAPPPPPSEEEEEAREAKRQRAEAVKAKEAGNEAYKKKEFDAAIQHYNKAMELDSTDISFITNRCGHVHTSLLVSSPPSPLHFPLKAPHAPPPPHLPSTPPTPHLPSLCALGLRSTLRPSSLTSAWRTATGRWRWAGRCARTSRSSPRPWLARAVRWCSWAGEGRGGRR